MVNFVYRDETLKGSELTSKLEPAFLAGLRCVQPTIRSKFFEVKITNKLKKMLQFDNFIAINSYVIFLY